MFIFTRSRQLMDFSAPHLYDYTLDEVAQCLYRTTHERADTLQELLDQRR